MPWFEFAKGDRVKVRGEYGVFVFHAHVRNEATGAEWLDVFGGPPKYETMRSFHADRVSRTEDRVARRRSPRAA